jgi:hypothetical protein
MDFLHAYATVVKNFKTATHRFIVWLLWYLLIDIFAGSSMVRNKVTEQERTF